VQEETALYRKIIVISGIVLAIAGCGGKTVEQLYAEGVQQLQKGNPGGAIVLLKNALEKDQNHLDARYQLAKAYAGAGKREQAEKEFQKVLRQNPSREEVNLELAKIHFSVKKPDLAIQESSDYLKTHPGSAEALEILGAAHFAANNPGEAERCLLQALKGEPSRISAKLELAGIYGAQRKIGEAKEILSGVIAQDPKNSRAYYMLASFEASAGNRDKALEIYQKIAEINPADAMARYKTGMIYLDKGEKDRAAKTAEEIIAKFPKRAEGYRLKGIVAYQRQNLADAVAELQRANKMQPTMEGYYFLGLSLYAKGELETALSQFRVILDHNPSFIQARLLTGMILLSQKRVDDSIVEINKVLLTDGKNALAHNLLGSAYMAKGMNDEGLKELNRATELDPKLIDAHIKKGIFHLSKGNAGEAETDLRTAVKVRPELLNTRLILFSHYMRRNDKTKALVVLKEGLTGKKEDAVLYNSMAAVAFAENKPAEAAKHLQKAKEADPAFFAPYFNLATYYTTTGNNDKALAEYGAVLQKDPQNLQAMLGTAALQELNGKEGEALTSYTKAMGTGNPAAFIALAGYHARKKEPGKAITVIDEAIKANPRNADLLELKGRLCMAEKKHREAIKAFDDVEAINSDRGIPLKIGAYVAMKEIPKAVEEARRIITAKPNSSTGYLILASVYESQNDLDRAIAELKNGLNKDKESLQVMLKLGNLYARKKDYPLASSTLAEVVRKNPDLAPAYFSQGALLEMTGKKEEAVRKYRQAMAKAENYVPALNNLAYLCAEGFGTKEEALRLAVTAFKLEPGNGGIMDTLGYALLKNGRKEEARKALEKASALLPDNPTVSYHLALAYRESGDKGQATAKLQKALQSGDFPDAQKARTLLAELK
jgi:putative PEP-CTERM system TPR-repeat lipoprotein